MVGATSSESFQSMFKCLVNCASVTGQSANDSASRIDGQDTEFNGDV